MAIGSGEPIGENFGYFKIVDGAIDREDFEKWAKWFEARVKKDGLLFDYAKIIYPKNSRGFSD